MAGNDDLFKSMEMLRSSVKELAFTRALMGANSQVQEIKNSELDEAKKRSALSNVSNQLVSQMAAFGVPATTIQQVAGAMGPRRYSSPAEAAMEGAMSGDQSLINAASQADMAAQAGNIQQMKQQQAYDAQKQARQHAHELELAGMKASKGKPLTDNAIASINKFDDELMRGDGLLSRLDANPNFVGIGNNAWGAKTLRGIADPDFAAFKADVGQWFDAYRVRVTGAGASPGELKLLEENRPNVGDTTDAFRTKMNSILETGKKVRTRYLQNFKKAGRDVDAFLEDDFSQQSGMVPANPQQRGPGGQGRPGSARINGKVVKGTYMPDGSFVVAE